MAANSMKGMILPEVDISKCTSCGLCVKVCPILNIEGPKDQFETLSTGIFYATDSTLFEASSSGGAVGAILQYLFENDKIDCAVVTGITGIYAQPRIIRSSDEISKIQGSKYQPVALNTILSEIEKGDRFALVGLPCHIDGLKRLKRYNKQLREGLVVTIGIYCTIGRSLFSTHVALNHVNDPKGDLYYRYGVYPGNFGLVENSNFVHVSSYQEYLGQYDYFFYPRGCHFCDNLYNVHADISIGDTWGLDCGKAAIVMARTPLGEATVVDAVAMGQLFKIRDASRNENLVTQERSHLYKISNYYSRIKTLSLFTDPEFKALLPVSVNKTHFLTPYLFLYLFTVLFNRRSGYQIVSNKYFRKILLKIRNKLLRYAV